MSNTKTIVKNTGWYGLETALSAFLGLFTSIAIARTLGPAKMGYIIYVFWIATVVSGLGGVGISATARKYMAEFIGQGDRGTARHIYIYTLLLQTGLATVATGGFLVWVLKDASADYRLAAVLVVLSIWPAMVNFISAQANVAAEELSRNFPASFASMFIYFASIAATVVFRWGVVGVGASFLAMRTVDFLVRLFPTMRYVLSWEKAHAQPQGLRRRMVQYVWQSVVTMLLSLIVWDRSEFFLLKYLCADIREVAFYSVAFGVANNLLLSSVIFGSGAGATIFAQYGRDKSKLPALAATSFRYLALTSIPIHFIASALAVPALLLLYGNQYVGAASVVTIAPLLCLPKAFVAPIQSLLQSIERQSQVIVATVLAGIIDWGVAWALIPSHGAVGACIGCGVAQLAAVVIMWTIGILSYKVKLPWTLIVKITLISTAAALSAHFIASFLRPLLGIVLGGIAALAVLALLLYITHVLEPSDRARFQTVAEMLPLRLAGVLNTSTALLIPPESHAGANPPRANSLGSFIGQPANRFLKDAAGHLRRRTFRITKQWNGRVLPSRLVPIRVDACLRGGDSGIPAAQFARLAGDLRWASRPISEWPHVKLLREFERIGERIWQPGVFEGTEYYQNAAFNIEVFGCYFDAVIPDQIQWGARRFIRAYCGRDGRPNISPPPEWPIDPTEYISVHPVKHSSCFQVREGHHRLAAAYMKGMETVQGLILQPPVTTPLQDLLLDVLRLKGRRELCQPIDSPDVADWVLVRRCSDRAAMMLQFLRAENLMPPATRSYMDVACSYGWFVRELSKSGFQAEGIDSDPSAISVGKLLYGLTAEQLHRSDAVTFLRANRKRFDVLSCFSLAHDYVLNRRSASAEELLHMLDEATERVLFFDMGEEHEYAKLAGWNSDFILGWLLKHTTFTRIVRLGRDEDAVPPYGHEFGRSLFACVRNA